MSEQQTTLLPCPFCGGEAQTDFIEGWTSIIECHECHSQSDSFDTQEQAISAWNRRALAQRAPISDAQIQELVAQYWVNRSECVEDIMGFARALALLAAQGGMQIPRAALTEFIEKFCLKKSEQTATAESAFYWFNKVLAAQVDAPSEQKVHVG